NPPEKPLDRGLKRKIIGAALAAPGFQQTSGIGQDRVGGNFLVVVPEPGAVKSRGVNKEPGQHDDQSLEQESAAIRLGRRLNGALVYFAGFVLWRYTWHTFSKTWPTSISFMQRLSRQADWRLFKALTQGLQAIPSQML